MFTRYDDNLARHIYLRTLQDINEALCYKLVTDHLEEMLPIVCTPTIARLSLYTATGPGPGQPASVFTGATGRPERDRGSEPKPDRNTTVRSENLKFFFAERTVVPLPQTRRSRPCSTSSQ